MRTILKFIYTILFRLLHVYDGQFNLTGSVLWSLTVKKSKDAEVSLCNTKITRLTFSIDGEGNALSADGASMENCEIRISGKGNIVTLEPQSIIRNSVIVVNGNNCRVTIGASTRVGSMYMVCMGRDNRISMGRECMIADNVDIWATDSHPIYNDQGVVCNPSKPITIGNHVWIGKYAKVLKGVTVGDNAIIGMNTTVTKDVPEGTLVVEKDRVAKSHVNWSRDYIKV